MDQFSDLEDNNGTEAAAGAASEATHEEDKKASKVSWDHLGRGVSSSGSTSDYRLGGTEFDSRWQLGFFLFPSLLYPIISVSLFRSLV